jgi:multicomponent Na+:H+ antiporter subunit F
MSGQGVLDIACQIGLGMLLVAMLVAVVRLIRGPRLADRILALDLITVLATGFVGIFAVLTGFALYVDIAIALALVSFLSTVALARYLMSRAVNKAEDAQ